MREPKIGVWLLIALLLGSCTTFKTMNTIDTLPKDQPKGYISFFSDFSYFNPEGTVNVYRMDGGQQVFKGTTYDVLGSPSGVIEELRIAETPGSHGYRIAARQGPDREQEIWTGTIEVRENSITYVGIHELLLSSGYTPGNQYSSGSSSSTFYIIVSVGSTPLPVSSNPASDSALLARALGDGDWATRKLAIRAMSQGKDKPDDSIVKAVRFLAANDRYEGVRNEAVEYLKSRGLEAVPQPLYLDTFAINLWWPLVSMGANSNAALYFDRNGYHLEANSGYTVSVSLENLLHTVGFFGTDPNSIKNFTVELDCAWESGVVDSGYGLILGKGPQDYYAFCVSKNGGAMVNLIAGNSIAGAPIPWSQSASSTIQSGPKNIIEVKVAGDSAAFFVNDVSIGSFAIDRSYLSKGIGMGIFGKMAVTFDRLAIWQDK